MELNVEEKEFLEGYKGYPGKKAMQILVQLGEIYGAAKMLPVDSVHMPGSSTVVTGMAGLDFIESMAASEAKFVVETTLNPASVDLQNWENLGFDREDFEKQSRLTAAYRKMGAIPLHTCTPYHCGFFPLKEQHVSWGESSAVILANTLFAGRTNREGGPSALSAAITGKVPVYGYHLDENRRANVQVKVDYDLESAFEYGALGYHVGAICQQRIPVFTGIKKNLSMEQYKALGAALASSGSVAVFYIDGFSPLAGSLEEALGHKKAEDAVVFGLKQCEASVKQLNKPLGSSVDLVALGCPHASLQEIVEVASRLENRGKQCRAGLWLMTSSSVKKSADHLGLTEIIKRYGGEIVTDTCIVLGAMAPVIERNDIKNVATNSAKLAHYLPGQWSLGCCYGSTADCLNAAIVGGWE